MSPKTVSIALVAACLAAITASSASPARTITPGIGHDIFKARCQDKAGTYTSYRHGNVNCDLPGGGVATCNFIIPNCTFWGPGDVNLAASKFLDLGAQ